MKKTIFIIITFIFCIMIMVSCKNDTTSNDPAVTLNVYTSFGKGDGNHDTYQTLMKQFQKDYNVTISDHSEKSNEEWKESILSLFNSDNEPDVLFFFVGKDAEPLISDNQVVDVETIRAKYPTFGTNINTSVLNTMKASDGKNYAIPVSGYWEGLFINKDLFTKYDIPIPDNWDSFLNAITAFKQQNIIPIAASLGEVPHYWFEFLIYNHSGPAGHLTSVPTSENILSKAWVDGLNDLQTLYQMGAFPSDTTGITDKESFNLFLEKKAAMVLDGSWSVGEITDTDNVALIPFPSMENEARQNTDMIGGFSMGFYITKKAWDNPDKQKACVDFVNEITSNDSIIDFNKNGAASPSSIGAQNSTNPLMQSIALVNSESTAYISAVQDTIDLSVRNALFKRLPDIASGKINIEDALNEFVKQNQ